MLQLMRCCRRATVVRCVSSSPAFTLLSSRHASTRSKLFRVSEEVRDATQTGKPVVALETTIYTHGFPYPENVALASRLESLVRVNGGIPATIGVLNGTAHVGMDPDQLIQLISTAGSPDTWKISRRDLGLISGLGLRGRKLHGGTTISGTMVLAHLAGIKIFATGGLGGVHRGGENTMDISADLTELGRTPVCVVSSGCKSFLDIGRTLEYLETQGVGVATFADGRQGDVDFPAFFSRDSGVKSPQTIQSEADAAAIVHAQFQLGVQSGLLFANPVPEKAAMSKDEISTIIEQAVQEADQKGIRGAKNTPYVLKRIRDLSKGGSVTANRALVEANIVRGTKVAVELTKLEKADQEEAAKGAAQVAVPDLPQSSASTPATPTATSQNGIAEAATTLVKQTDLLVIGSLAVDTSCDYTPLDSTTSATSPILHTSNPAVVSQSPGGVGRNVATAARYAGAQVTLASAVADDLADGMLKTEVSAIGIDTSSIRTLSASSGARTAQYISVNDINKDLVLAMGDFSIFTRPEFEAENYWYNLVQDYDPKWIVLDGNWSSPITSAILNAASSLKKRIAFEPVSTAKAARLFDPSNTSLNGTCVAPNHMISLATPNKLELAAMHTLAQTRGLFESEAWWQCIDTFSLPSSGSRDHFNALTNPCLVDAGIPQQTIQLLPLIPNIITKLGADGCLLSSIIRKGDPRLTTPESAPYILSRNVDNHENAIGGIYMRLFPPAETVQQSEIVSVNGVGDTMLGVLMAGLTRAEREGQQSRLEDIIPIAQRAAVMTLKSREAVASEIRGVIR